jgi:hypothetical protein
MKAGHTTLMGKKRNAYGILPGNLYGKRPIGRSGHRNVSLEYIFKDILVMCESLFGMSVAGNMDQQRAFVNKRINHRFPYKAWNLLSS